jgi:hypothetical protein
MPSTIADHPLAIAFILVACAIIAVGRMHIRRARRNPSPAAGRRKILGWALVIFGALLMTSAIVLWERPLY